MKGKSPNILCVHQGWELYGSDRVFIQSLKALRQKWPDCKLTVHLPRFGIIVDEIDRYADNIIFGSMSVIRRNSFTLRSIVNLCKNLAHNHKQAKGKDIVYINTGVLLSYNILSVFKSKKYILHIHEIPGGLVRVYFSLLKKLSKARVIANSQATADAMKTGNVLYNGIRNIEYIKSNKEQDNLKLLLTGRINGWKGHGLAIEALSLLFSKGINNIEMHFLGDYFSDQLHYLSRLKKRITELDLGPYIHFHGFKSNPEHYYQEADIVLVPSTKPEPFGLVALEGMRAGLPVIAASHGGLKEIVIDQETGFLFEPNSAVHLSKAIERYHLMPELLKEHGVKGRNRFLNHFQEEHYIKKFIREIELNAA